MTDDNLITQDTITAYMEASGVGEGLLPQEKKMFLEIAKAYQLNPFKREIYCVPYGSGEYRKLSIITGYEVYIKRAVRTSLLEYWHVDMDGSFQHILKTVTRTGKNGKYDKQIETVDGDMSATITIGIKGWTKPFVHTVWLEEYVQDNEMWNSKTRTMLQKVVIAQGFRLAFPDELGGMPYCEDELPLREAEGQETAPARPAKEEPKATKEEQRPDQAACDAEAIKLECRALSQEIGAIISSTFNGADLFTVDDKKAIAAIHNGKKPTAEERDARMKTLAEYKEIQRDRIIAREEAEAAVGQQKLPLEAQGETA